MGSVMEASILHHVGIVLVVLCLLNSYSYCSPLAYLFSFIYLFLVHERYVMRLRKTLEFEEKRTSNQRRVLSDSETVRWLNLAVEKMWPVCLEQIVSQKILLPLVPWFLEKYKPWTVKEAVVQQLYLGRSPPTFTEMRVHQSRDDDHLVLELGLNFLTADDMKAELVVKLRKRLGFGMSPKMHLLGMHVEGKVLIGLKFVRNWPFIGRIRLCFVEPPYFQMTVKPIFSHGLDVTELPGIAGWLDKLLAVVFEQTLVEPNMLVVDVEKFASPTPESWFSIDEKEPVAHALVEVLEAADLKSADLNGLSDPYVKGQLGPYRFRTKTHKKTLAPKWHEEFRVPISSWDSANILSIEVRDKDRFVDDKLGECSVNVNELRDGQRHDMWLPLQNVKLGRLHLAIRLTENNVQETSQERDEDNSDEYKKESFADCNKGSLSLVTSEKSQILADKYEPIDVEGQRQTGMWVHQPGSEYDRFWEPRKGKGRQVDSQINREGDPPSSKIKSKASESVKTKDSNVDKDEDEKIHQPNPVDRAFHKIGSFFHRRRSNEEKYSFPEVPVESPRINLRSVNSKEIGVKFIMDDRIMHLDPASANSQRPNGKESSEGSGPESPHKGNTKDKAKYILKQSARGIKHVISRKGSRNFKRDSRELAIDKGVPESESSDEEPVKLPASTGVIEVHATPVSSYDIIGSQTPTEHTISSPSNHAALNIAESSNKDGEAALKAHDDGSAAIEGKNVLVEESASPILDADK